MTELPSDFYFPPGATAPLVASVEAKIYSSSEFERLYPYLANLQSYFQSSALEITDRTSPFRRSRLGGSLSLICRPLVRLRRRIKKVDALVVGESSRPSDVRMMKRLVTTLAQGGLSVAYLGSLERQEMATWVEEQGLNGVEVINLSQTLGRWEQIAVRRATASEAARDWQTIADLLCGEPVSLTGDYVNRMRRIARIKLLWSWVGKSIAFDFAIVRNHQSPLSACVALNAIAAGKPTVSFQHGVISTYCGYLPVVATRLVCYGQASIEILRASDQSLADRAGRRPFCKQFVPAGSLVDDIDPFPSRYEERTLLVIDQDKNKHVNQFYGISFEFDALQATVRTVLERIPQISRVIVRAHPSNKNPDRWLSLAVEYPHRIEISPPSHGLNFDLSRSSVAIGLFSGALVTAAACGVPSMFLWKPGWYYTPDLACFTTDFFVSPESVPGYLSKVLSTPDVYNEARDKAIAVSKQYYHNGETCMFSPEFVESLLTFV